MILLNEHIKSTLHIMLPTYVKLFNLVFDKAIVPESWLLGDIIPIYKKKGDVQNPENYRPITLLSCLGKLFTSIINTRLIKFTDERNIITDSQTGFRKGFSTSDNLFVINCLIDILKSRSKKLFCAFVDFKQAFDTVWRDGLWQKMTSYSIDGKCLNLIRNLYNNIKSQIKTETNTSAYFPCFTGVRQGENLSPFLFAIFLNDLGSYLNNNAVPGLRCEYNDDELYIFLKLFILLYADDTVIFGESETDLQKALNVFQNYCDEWKLTVNISKTKIMIFSRGRQSKKFHFFFNSTELEIVPDYKYLGIYLSRTYSYIKAKKHIAEQANKALFSLLKKIRTLDLSFDLQITLFNKTVKPILLYGCEIWGHGNLDILERIQLKFLKHIFNLKRSTPSFMIYGDLGITPIAIDIKSRVVSYWSKLISMHDQPTRTSYLMYKILYNMHKNKICKSNYIENIKDILNTCGFSGIWETQNTVNPKWLTLAISQRLKDQFYQTWTGTVNQASSGTIYRLFKDTSSLACSKYISLMSNRLCKILMRFRTRNHILPIEIGKWNGTSLHERICPMCLADIGDEYHYILICEHFRHERINYVKQYYYRHPNVIKFTQLMNTENKLELQKLCKFIEIITNAFK